MAFLEKLSTKQIDDLLKLTEQPEYQTLLNALEMYLMNTSLSNAKTDYSSNPERALLDQARANAAYLLLENNLRKLHGSIIAKREFDKKKEKTKKVS